LILVGLVRTDFALSANALEVGLDAGRCERSSFRAITPWVSSHRRFSGLRRRAFFSHLQDGDQNPWIAR
jgi:hypothetical protein